MSVDAAKIEAFVRQVVADMSAGLSGVMTNLGHKLGFYKAMAGAGPMTPAELAGKTRTHERYVREWLNNQAASGYVDYDPRARTYSLPEEHAMVLANAGSPVFMAPGFDVVSSLWLDEDKVAEARLREIMAEAGFGRCRRATETPFNLVLEARP